MRRPALFLAVFALAACHVSRLPEETTTGPADLPRLRRATTALKELIQLEKQHVAHFNTELRATRERERAVAFEVQEAESDYQRLLGDLGGVEADLADLDAELAEARQSLDAQREALTATRGEIAATEAELEVLVATGRRHEETRAELEQRLERASQAEADEARAVESAEAALEATRGELAVTLAALQRSRTAEALLSRELLLSLLISSLRGEGPGALARPGLIPELASASEAPPVGEDGQLVPAGGLEAATAEVASLPAEVAEGEPAVDPGSAPAIEAAAEAEPGDAADGELPDGGSGR